MEFQSECSPATDPKISSSHFQPRKIQMEISFEKHSEANCKKKESMKCVLSKILIK